jgi:hypothetical protein
MVFAGYPISTLLAIFGAVGALTVLLYVLKLRRRPVAVPFARIWQSVLGDKEATTLFSQLRRILSLLLQLALVALLVFALGDPRSSGGSSKARHIVVLVDASASMKATDVAPSRFEVARLEAQKLVRGLGAADRMLIAALDGRVTPLSSMTQDTAELEAAIGMLEATDTRADLRHGVLFALDSLRGLSEPEIVLVSDGAFAEPEALAGIERGAVTISYVPVGRAGQNVAITAFSVRRYPLDKSRYEVMLEVTSTMSERVDVELSLYGDGDVVDVTRLSLAKEERLSRFYQDLGGASRTLEARIRTLNAPDYLPADDRAYALMPERRRARVLVVTSGNTYLEAALLLDEYLDVTELTPESYPPPKETAYDVTIFDGVAPMRAAHTGAALYLSPPAEGSPVKLGRRIESFGFDTWERKDPLLRWMAMGDIQALHGHALVPGKGDRVVGASELGPILVAGRGEAGPYVVLGFDPRQSDLVLRVAWPLFVLNSINAFVEENTGYLSSYRTGEVWRVPAPSGARSATVKAPDGSVRPVVIEDGRAVLSGTMAGFYELVASVEGEVVPHAFAANLVDPKESRIEPAQKLELGGEAAGEPTGFVGGVRREFWMYLLLAVISVSLIEWFTYHRRVTV